MKKTIFTLLIFLSSFVLKAQYPYYEWVQYPDWTWSLQYNSTLGYYSYPISFHPRQTLLGEDTLFFNQTLLTEAKILGWDYCIDHIGDHLTQGYMKFSDSTDYVTPYGLAQMSFLTSENDPIWNADKTNYWNKTQADSRFLYRSDTSFIATHYWAESNFYNKTQADARYLQSYTETDPLFNSKFSGKTTSDLAEGS